MKRFKNILYILDGTAITQEGRAEKIATLARLNAARVSVIMTDETTILNDLSLKISGRYAEMKKELSTGRLSQLHQLLGQNHIPLESGNIHLIEGMSEAVIKQAITELNVDVLVMGSVARSGIPGLLIGNKAEKLLTTINCTVLTIKPDGFVSPVTLD